ncbi:hypothetical protein [Pseudomonas mandelii]|uniref:hypothetical protein n=1 Tax=Pseudomonas mandelii TaxID=75612 RepID=UPI003C765220
MLPLAIGAMLYVTVLNVVLLAFVGLPALLIALCVPAWRRQMLRQPRRFGALGLVCLSVVGAMSGNYWLDAANDRARKPTLEHDVQVEGLPLPAGTRLHLSTVDPLDQYDQPQAHGLPSLIAAEFVAPHRIKGINVTALEMFGPPYVKLRLASDQAVDGWPCANDTWVTFEIDEETRLQPDRWRFESCTLVANTEMGGLTWPSGSYVHRYGEEYELTPGGKRERVVLQRVALSGPTLTLKLDKQQKAVGWEGQLNDRITFGDWQYPRLTRVREDSPHTLLFSPNKSNPAHNLRTGEMLKAGHSILQRSSDGAVQWIMPNTGLGLADW